MRERRFPADNLPIQLDSFIGRTAEITRVKDLLHKSRLVTLTGPGGCGKTRLALQVAGQVVEEFADGAWLIDLSSLTDPDLLPQAVAASLQLRDTPGQPIAEVLRVYLKTRHILLVVDNCEHLIEACAQLAHEWLSTSPQTRILATSREALHIPGEIVFQVPHFPAPDPKTPVDIPDLMANDAIRLFVDRAQAQTPDFSLTEQDAAPVLQICSRVDGNPLAIELAAAQIPYLSTQQIASRLDDSLRLLVRGSRTALLRQQTLRATLEWSYNLLPDQEKILLRRLGIFDGSFSLEAVETICAGEGILKEEIVHGIAQLIAKSLVRRDSSPDQEPRYRLLVVMRQYCREKLRASEEEPFLNTQFLDYFTSLAETAETELFGPQQSTWISRLQIETDNLREALRLGLIEPIPSDQGLRLASALAQFWQLRGHMSEGLQWLELALAHAGEAPMETRAKLLGSAGFMSGFVEDYEQAKTYHEEALMLAQRLEEAEGVAWELTHLGWNAALRGDFQQAQTYAEQSLRLHQENRDQFGAAVTLFCLGDVAYLRKEFGPAIRFLEKSVSLTREVGNQWAELRRLVRLGQIHLNQGETTEAVSLLDEAVQLGHQTGDRWGTAMAYAGLAEVSEKQNHPDRATWLIGKTQALLDRTGARFWQIDRMEFERCIQAVRDQLDEDRYTQIWKEGYAAFQEDEITRSPAQFALPDFAPWMRRPKPRQATPLQAAKEEFGGLTRREREVTGLIALGKSNADIAAELFIGIRTVEAHVTRILTQLGFTSRVQIAAWAVERGLGKPKSAPTHKNP